MAIQENMVVSPAERRALRLIRSRGPRTRAQMARDLNVSATTAMRIVDKLTIGGLLREGEKIVEGRGQPSATVMLMPGGAYAIGVSLMTDAYVVLVVDLLGNVMSERMIRRHVGDRIATIEDLRQRIGECIFECRIEPEKICGVGVGIPGFFVEGTGQFNTPEQIADWSFVDLSSEMTRSLGFPVLLENDGNAAAIGEAMVGVGRRVQSFAYLYFADGFGGGVIVGGEPLRGSQGNAGEFHAALTKSGLAKPDMRLLRECLAASGTATDDLADLCARFDPSWPGVEMWLDLAAPAVDYLADAISGILDPDAIVLGGRIPASLAGCLADRIKIDPGRRREHGRHVPKVVPSEAVADAVALGSAALALKVALYA